MALSQISDKIIYKEDKKLYDDDVGFNASMYKIDIYNLEIIVALGDIKYDYISDGILYAPIYLIHKKKVGDKIGIYEFLSEDLINLLDIDGDLELEKLQDPLLYKFVTYEYLKRNGGKEEKKEEEEKRKRRK